MQPYIPVQPDSVHLDALIARLKDEGESELLIEHLQTASAYLHGAMPGECSHNLEMAHEMCGGVHAKSLEGELKDTIAELLHDLHPALPVHWWHRSLSGAPPPTAQGLREFFHGGDSSLGIFYPRKHVMAVFRSFHKAEAARDLLRADGLRPGEVIATPGCEAAGFFAELRGQHSFWSELMMHLSRLLDTEAGLVDRYAKWARRGSGFLAVYCPTDTQAEELAEILRPLNPVAMHWFTAGYIRHLM